MARIPVSNKAKPLKMEKFLGYHNEETGDTQIKLNESGNMTNYYITKNWKLKKIEGYQELFEDLESEIQGMFYGNIGGTNYFLFACDGHVYSHNLSTGVNTSIGTLTDAPTNFFAFDDKVYIQNGYEYKSYDGTTFGNVTGYIPIVAIDTPPAGGGTDYQNINLLIGSKIQWFDADGSSTIYQLRETDIDSIDAVYYNDVLQTVTTDYTVNLTNGTVTPTTPSNWATGENNVTIQWTKDDGGTNRSLITGHKHHMLFGPGNNTRVFIYGNEDEQHRYRYSDLEYGEIAFSPSAEYFPTNNFSDQDSENYAITDMKRTQANYFIILKENIARYGVYDIITDSSGGEQVAFRTYDLNGAVGHVAPAQSQVLNDTLHSINDNSLRKWISTEVDDERNAPIISSKIRPDLEALDMTNAVTIDWQDRTEWWVAVGTKVFVYNYELTYKSEEDSNRYVGTYSPLELNDIPTCFIVIDGNLYFGTTTGTIMKFDEDYRTFNGVNFNRHWEMKFYDFGESWLRKSLHRTWLQMQPESKAKLTVNLVVNNSGQYGNDYVYATQTITYNTMDYETIDYSAWSYLTDYNPQPKRLKEMKARKFTYCKLVFDDTDDYNATILGINMKYSYGGESK